MKSILICLMLVVISHNTSALTTSEGDNIAITDTWARPTANSNTPGGVFFTIKNKSDVSVILAGAKSDIANMAHIHMTKNEDGMMKMDSVEGLVIRAGEEVRFAPGGYHIMLMGLKQKLTKGDVFQLTLTFEQADNIVVPVPVTGMMGPSAKDVP